MLAVRRLGPSWDPAILPAPSLLISRLPLWLDRVPQDGLQLLRRGAAWITHVDLVVPATRPKALRMNEFMQASESCRLRGIRSDVHDLRAAALVEALEMKTSPGTASRGARPIRVPRATDRARQLPAA